jgi:hypothetical protein
MRTFRSGIVTERAKRAPAKPNLSDRESARAWLIAQWAVDQAWKRYPWYDSGWLRRFVAAKAFIRTLRPELTESFLAALEPLRTDPGFSAQRLPSFLDPHRLHLINSAIAEIPVIALEVHEKATFGRCVVHNLPEFVELQKEFESLASEIAGEPVQSSYNFLSLYSRFGECEPHIDAPTAKWTLDICLDQSRPWPLHISQVVDWPENRRADDSDWRASIRADLGLHFKPYALSAGDAIMFSGSSQWHYRDPLPGATDRDFCTLLFFHFLPAGMGRIAEPVNWPDHFGMPELAWVVGAAERPAAGKAGARPP